MKALFHKDEFWKKYIQWTRDADPYIEDCEREKT